MPCFRDVKHVTPIKAQDFSPFDGIAIRGSISSKQKVEKEHVDPARVQQLTQKFVEAASGSSSAICLAALDDFRNAVRPTEQEVLAVGESSLNTDRRMKALVGIEVSEQKISVRSPNEGLKLVQEQPEPEPKDIQYDTMPEGSILKVDVDKQPGTALGITLCWADQENLVISGLGGGLVQGWNLGRSKDRRVSVGDTIVSFNGEAGNVQTLKRKMMSASGPFSFEVKTHTEYIVKLTRGDNTQLGLDVSNKANEQMLLVKRVLDGSVNEWNAAHPKEQVGPGDRILKLNQKDGPSEELRRNLKACKGSLVLTMSRFESDSEPYSPHSPVKGR